MISLNARLKIPIVDQITVVSVFLYFFHNDHHFTTFS